MVFLDCVSGFDLVETFFEGLDALGRCLEDIDFYVQFVNVLRTKNFVLEVL